MPHELYQLDDGTILPSVTEILDVLGSKVLMRWSNSLGFRHIDYTSYMDKTALRGTICHEIISHCIDPSMPIGSYQLSEEMFREIRGFETEIKKFAFSSKFKPEFMEKPFISKELGYAGCPDFFGTIRLTESPKGYEGVTKFPKTLVDWKTSKRPQEKQFLQLGGYSKLLKIFGYVPQYYMIVNFHVDSKPYITVKNKYEILPYEESFGYLFDFWKIYSGIDTSVWKTKR